MARKSSSRKTKHTKKHRHHRRVTRRRNGGGNEVNGASVNYHLSGSWPSKMSLGQGADYFKYHEGQHGGGLDYGKFPEAVLSPGLPDALRGPAHIGGIDKAIADVKNLCDPPNCPTATTGGRRKHTRRHKKSHHKRRHSHHKRHHKRRHSSRRRTHGGTLGYAPFPSSGMLLNSSKQYAQAGLNPEWKTDVAFTDAKIRETQ